MGVGAENLSYHYERTGYAIKDVNLEIDSGEFVLVTGPSSSGKTTLVYSLSGIIPNLHRKGKREGKVWIDGNEASELSSKELTEKISVVFQNSEAQIFGLTVEEDAAFALENMGVERERMRKKVEENLKRVNLFEERERNPNNLSGGQKQRLALASALITDPEILVLDEPTSNLDPEGRERIITTLRNLKESGKTIILVERKLDRLVELTDRVVGLNSGEVVSNHPTRKFFRERENLKLTKAEPPKTVETAHHLMDRGHEFEKMPLNFEELKKYGPFD